MSNTLATFWSGAPLGIIEQLSALSAIKHGHHLVIYAYDDIKGAPDGVELRDAREILDTTEIVKHRKTGSVAIHSDLFRYALLQKTDFTWIDLDIILLKPLPLDQLYIFGYESTELVNNAVLRLPRDSRTLQELCKFNTKTRGYPPTLTGLRRLKYILKSLGLGLHISDWPWGSTGPLALTRHLRATGEVSNALPIDAFYSIPHKEAHRFAMKDEINFHGIASTHYAVHLWAKDLRRNIKDTHAGRVPENSFLCQCARYFEQELGVEVKREL